MAVASRGAALSAVRALITHDPVPVETLLRRPYLPSDLQVSDDSVTMTPETLVGGYGDESRYVLAADPATARAIAGPPAGVLAGQPSITTDTVSAYAKSSLDLTMEGGTTSGVVYPLAVCELATAFRFRNVGGASAGAIAAAMTAAAELGRSSRVLTGGAVDDAAASEVGVRPGFVGLTDIISWLTQTQPGDPERDEYRLGQLFRPGRATARIFRLIIAVMRGRGWSFPLVALFAFGPVTRTLAVLAMVVAVVLTGWVANRFTETPPHWGAIVGWGLLGAAGFAATLVAAVVLVQAARAIVIAQTPPQGSKRLQQLRTYTSAYGVPVARIGRPLAVGVGLVALVVLLAVLRPPLYAAALLVGLAATLLVAVVLVRAVAAYLARLRTHAYGLVPGATPSRSRNLLDVLAGVPAPTVDLSLIPWLTQCLNALAGLGPRQVLRFGHLWAGPEFEARRAAPSADDRRAWERMSTAPDECLVNLQLMTTDLTRQRPFRFPLQPWADQNPEQLWVCVEQLRSGDSAMFTEEVLAALEATESRQVHDQQGEPRILHRLPQPWDLPVIFAVRISMALPALFEGVRMYRILPRVAAQDDLGRTLLDGGSPLVLSGSLEVAQELWFSDGGITSNFPVHFFDNPLPRWPTVSLNLGTHPDDAPHTDVWLPQDWEQLTAPAAAIGPAGFSYAGAVFNTALNWRDSLQSALPGYRNRTAQVRTGAGEGGNNLFMSREIVASMALRGALAGARLRTRFSDSSHWDRFRWLRLRTAMNNLEASRVSVQRRRGFYADALAGPDWLTSAQAAFEDRPLDRPAPWYQPAAAYWPKAARLLNTFADAYRPAGDPTDVMTDGSPMPQPVLRQVPTE